MGFFAHCNREQGRNEIHYKVNISTLFFKRNATFHGAFFSRLSVFVLMVSDPSCMPIKGYFRISLLSSTQAILTTLAKFHQDMFMMLGAANVILWVQYG